MYKFRVENDFYISNEEIHSSENGVVVEFKINVILFMIFLLLIPKLFLSFSALFSNIPSAKLVMQANFKFILIILSHHHLMRFNFQSTRSNFGHLFSNFNAIFLILLVLCPVGQSKQVVVVNRANPSAIYREAWQYTLYVLLLLCSITTRGGREMQCSKRRRRSRRRRLQRRLGLLQVVSVQPCAAWKSELPYFSTIYTSLLPIASIQYIQET